MQRRTFFKLVGLSAAACAAGSALYACDGVAAVNPLTTAAEDGEHVIGQPAITFSASTDVLIIGSGVAGLSAAMAPAEAGYKVMVAEKLDLLGGESYESNAIMNVVGSGLQRDAGLEVDLDAAWEERRAQLAEAGVEDLDFAKILFYATGEWVDRLRETYGAQFADPKAYATAGVNEGIVLPKNGIGDMESIMVPLRDNLAAKGVTFSTDYRATAFIVDSAGAVCGVRFTVKKDNSAVDVRAQRVVVATGGFASDQALMRDYLPDWQYVGCCTAASMGEGHRLCETLGAQLASMDSAAPLIGDVPQASSWGLFAPVVCVDALGNRFAREDSQHEAATACFKDGRGYWWTVFDSQMTGSGQSRSAAQVTSKNANRLIGPFDSIEDLAGGMGAPAATLTATFDRYNAAAAAGTDTDFGRTVHLGALEPPYYAIKQFPVRFRTRGGAKTDESGRMLGTAGTTVEGVYCCGAVSALAGEGLATNGAFGMIVGQTVVDDLAAAEDAETGAEASASGAADAAAEPADAAASADAAAEPADPATADAAATASAPDAAATV